MALKLLGVCCEFEQRGLMKLTIYINTTNPCIKNYDFLDQFCLYYMNKLVCQSTASLPVNQQSSCYNNGKTQGEEI